jgi:transposase
MTGGFTMSGKKGMQHYPEEFKRQIELEYQNGASLKSLSRKYKVSRYSVQSWCGLRPEVEFRQAAPLPKGHKRSTPERQEQLIHRLQMENELLRNFLSAVGRR